LLEHHSNLDEEHETRRSRLAAENWDAPVVVTTSVQFFESLFASRTGRARKLHNIADSVVVLDEVQLLPADYLRPILDAVQALTDQFRTTFLFMTATQPAWDTSHGETGSLPKLRGIREVVPDPLQLHERLRRVRVRTPRDMTTATEWEDLAEAFVEHPSALCVVNRRQDARVLFEALRAKDPDAVHLSALMCGAHRSEVIAGIRKTLHEGRSIRVVSTQLVEAGVDLDFPVVFRAMAGLDSIAQAAGRCNREGHLSLGEVRVFVPPTSPPPGVLRQAETVTRTMLAEGLTDLLSPWAFRAFFRQLYWLRGENLDKYGICKLLDHDGRVVDLAYAFRTASDRFQIIPGANQVPVVVRWKGHPQATRVERAIAAFEGDAPDRWAFRALQRSLVTLHQWNLRPLLEAGAVSQIHERMFLLVDASLYDDRVGLRLDPEAIRDPEEMVV
jgi:CRISPR-associated endonuclease/helicase Cas3